MWIRLKRVSTFERSEIRGQTEMGIRYSHHTAEEAWMGLEAWTWRLY